MGVVCSVMPLISGGRPSSYHHEQMEPELEMIVLFDTFAVTPALALEIKGELKLFRCLCIPGPRDWSGSSSDLGIDLAVLPWIIVSVDGQLSLWPELVKT